MDTQINIKGKYALASKIIIRGRILGIILIIMIFMFVCQLFEKL